ncbi:MAG: sigma-70 family RNA polymerase sigma factor [Aureliella sp.]
MTHISEEEGDSTEGSLPAHWVDEHADALYRFALRKVSDRHVVEDLLQETYLAAHKAKDSFRGDSCVRTWLIAILRLKIIDHYRVKARDARREESLQKATDSFRAEALKAWDCTPDHTVENEEFWQAFHRCVEKLPATLARAFLLREVDGCKPTQVCKLLDISSSNLAVRIYRARVAMRDCLDTNWFTKD